MPCCMSAQVQLTLPMQVYGVLKLEAQSLNLTGILCWLPAYHGCHHEASGSR